MNYLNKYYYNITQIDLLTLFEYTNTKELPKINQIILNIPLSLLKMNELVSSCLVLDSIVFKKSFLHIPKNYKNLYKPIFISTNLKIHLRKNAINNFFLTFLKDYYYSLNNRKELSFYFNLQTINFTLKHLNLFNTLNYSILINCPKIKINTNILLKNNIFLIKESKTLFPFLF